MKKLFLSMIMMALPLLVSAYDTAVENADGVTIYYNLNFNDYTMYVVKEGSRSYSGVVNIPEEIIYSGRTRKVTGIGGGAFQDCSSLTSVAIPNSVTSIGESAFSNCSGLTSVTIPNSVTSIERSAFHGCTGLTSVTIPNSVTRIGHRAFGGCSGLTALIVEEGNPNYDSRGDCNAIIETGTNSLIAGCMNTIIPNSVTSIGSSAFSGCSSLTSATIPNSVITIGGSAFSGCSCLTSVTIPSSVTTIGNSAFYNCIGLTSVTIPNSVTSIADWAFYGCSTLTSVTIPNSVTIIGSRAFSDCSGLTSVNIGNSVTTIGGLAFSNCHKLEEVYCLASKVPSAKNDAFDNSGPQYASLYVYADMIKAFKSVAPWSDFGTIKSLEESGIVPNPDPDNPKCATPSISYANKELSFSCATDGVEYHYTITDSDIKSDVASRLSLSATYEISVYASKNGYNNSDIATATLVWTEAIFTKTTEPSTSAKAVTESIPVLISAKSGTITVTCEQEGQPVAVYSVDGKALGNATVSGGQATIATPLQNGQVAIVKVGNRSVKIAM